MNWRGPERSRTVERALLLVLAKVPLWSLWYKNKYRELYLECGSLLPLFFFWSCHSARAFSRTPYPGALFCTSALAKIITHFFSWDCPLFDKNTQGVAYPLQLRRRHLLEKLEMGCGPVATSHKIPVTSHHSRLDEAFLKHLLVAQPQIGEVG